MDIRRMHGGAIPPLPFEQIKDMILGKKYELSLLFADTKTSTQLHQEFKKKPGPANTLAFPLDTNQGEIIMHLGTIRQEAPKFEHSYHQHLAFMFIHSCLHLKGHDHGTEMEKLEQHFMKKLKL